MPRCVLQKLVEVPNPVAKRVGRSKLTRQKKVKLLVRLLLHTTCNKGRRNCAGGKSVSLILEQIGRLSTHNEDLLLFACLAYTRTRKR